MGAAATEAAGSGGAGACEGAPCPWEGAAAGACWVLLGVAAAAGAAGGAAGSLVLALGVKVGMADAAAGAPGVHSFAKGLSGFLAKREDREVVEVVAAGAAALLDAAAAMLAAGGVVPLAALLARDAVSWLSAGLDGCSGKKAEEESAPLKRKTCYPAQHI